jgi:6-pyruvoyltetrahydropterin/6-carboxytetrahydropterin synthase
MFEVTVEHTFAAAHYLRDYKGKCERLHGHNYRVMVTLRGKELDKAGMLVDFTEMKRALKAIRAVRSLSSERGGAVYAWLNPSAENMAKWFAERLKEELLGGSSWQK